MYTPSNLNYDVLHQIEISSREKVAVNNWWQEFSKVQHQLNNYFNGTDKLSFDLAEWIHSHLHKIHQDIMWEFGPGIKKNHRLVITSEQERILRPLIHYILNKAPDFKDWEFYEYRLPESLDEAKHTMASRTHWDNISNIEFELNPSQYNTIDIIYHIPHSLSIKEGIFSVSYCLYVLTEALLGEEILDKWIGCINICTKTKNRIFSKFKKIGRPLSALRESVLEQIMMTKSQLPASPYYKLIADEKVIWCSYTATPIEAEEYDKKKDLYVSTFIGTEHDLFNATYHGNDNFFSERYSNHNEIFVYLKIDGAAQDLNQEIFIDRTTIEDALNDALTAEDLGGVIGGGTGLRYSYIDLALIDLKRAIPKIKNILQNGNLTRRSWILFYDAIYQSQYIGIWDDTPQPPM